MRRLIRQLCIVGSGGLAAPALAEQIRHCELTVNGKSYIDGPCDYEPVGGGDFVIRQGPYFAYVYVAPEPRPNGYWNGDPPGNHAHDPLGDLQRQEGCWINDRARVCAER